MDMNYCMQCGTKLRMKYHEGHDGEDAGMVPWCDGCESFRWPVFNTAVSMIVLNETKDKILLIKPPKGEGYVFVAGYVMQGEEAEETARREVLEEVGLTVTSEQFRHSRYYPRTNTLMLNFTVTVKDEAPKTNYEVQNCRWFTPDEARENIRHGSLAEAFLLGYLDGGVYQFPF